MAILYAPRYAPASSFTSWLLVGVARRLPNAAAAQLMIAMGHVGRTPQITLVRLLWIIVMIPIGFIFLGPMGVVAAMGLVEVPPTVYCWFLLRRVGVLDVREELSVLGLTSAGGAIGWIGATELLHLFPHL